MSLRTIGFRTHSTQPPVRYRLAGKEGGRGGGEGRGEEDIEAEEEEEREGVMIPRPR